MERSVDNVTFEVQSLGLPPCNYVDTDKIASSPYFQAYVSAWGARFPKDDIIASIQINGAEISTEEQVVFVPAAQEQPAAAVTAKAKKAHTCRRFPLLLVCILSVVALAVAVLGAFKIDAIAKYVALSGKYESVAALADCFKAGGATIEGVFSYVLPAALYLSLAVVVIVLIISIIGMAKRCCCGISWLSLVALLLGLLSAVSLYLVMDAPPFADFISFSGDNAIGYGLVGIVGLELIIFIVSLFAARKAKA